MDITSLVLLIKGAAFLSILLTEAQEEGILDTVEDILRAGSAAEVEGGSECLLLVNGTWRIGLRQETVQPLISGRNKDVCAIVMQALVERLPRAA